VGVDSTGKIVVSHADTSIGERPQTEGFGSFIYLAIGITIGTLLVLLLVKFQKPNIWRAWFFIAVWMALSISIGVFVKAKIFFNYDVAMFIALVLALWKIYKTNVFIHNFTEVLMYSGIALLIVPLFDLLWAVVLLIVISLYDMYAVWKSKHMVKMAKFQTRSNVFAGLMIPYKVPKESKDSKVKTAKIVKSSAKTSTPKNAILGGGDVVFPLIFSGVVMEGLLREGLTKSQAFLQTSIISVTTMIALALLFFFAKKDKFYPAMPFVTLGCLIGWAIVLLI
jgi:presenilin-like A22 family membrane protease